MSLLEWKGFFQADNKWNLKWNNDYQKHDLVQPRLKVLDLAVLNDQVILMLNYR
jgi:hypothetical protein